MIGLLSTARFYPLNFFLMRPKCPMLIEMQSIRRRLYCVTIYAVSEILMGYSIFTEPGFRMTLLSDTVLKSLGSLHPLLDMNLLSINCFRFDDLMLLMGFGSLLFKALPLFLLLFLGILRVGLIPYIDRIEFSLGIFFVKMNLLFSIAFSAWAGNFTVILNHFSLFRIGGGGRVIRRGG